MVCRQVQVGVVRRRVAVCSCEPSYRLSCIRQGLVLQARASGKDSRAAIYLGVGIDDTGDDIVVDVSVLASQRLHARNSFLLGLVCEHRASNAIADGVDARDAGREITEGGGHDALGLVEL